MKSRFFIFIFLLAIVSCRKKADDPITEPEPDPPVVIDTAFKCANLPPYPEPFGWADSTFDENQNVNAFLRNPANGDELIIVVNGDAFGYNKMYAYNVRLKSARYLATLDKYLPDINSQGWIVYSNADNNIYKIKSSGDSSTAISQMKRCHDAKWDYSGNFIYYLQDAYLNVPTQLIKSNSKGTLISGFPMPLANTAPFNKSDQVIFQQAKDNSVTLIQKNMSSFDERVLITGPFESHTQKTHFNNLTIDQGDEYFYWSNEIGIFRCNLSSLHIDTVFKNCQNIIYIRPIMSVTGTELNFTKHTIRPIGPFTLYHRYQNFEIDLPTGVMRELDIFE